MAVAPSIGWPLFVVPDTNGQLHYPNLEDSVRQSIQVILRTRPGEQLMHPEYGGGLEQFVHEPNTLTTRRRIRDVVGESLEEWEPRIVVDRVEVWDVADQPTHIRIEICYRLRRSGVPKTLGVTLELEA